MKRLIAPGSISVTQGQGQAGAGAAEAVFVNGGPPRDTSVDRELDQQLDQARTLESDGADLLDSEPAGLPPPDDHSS